MAPQYGNKHGTLAIEPVSTRIVHKGVWEDFKEELAKVWMSYTDFDGTPLKSRVHWAKVSFVYGLSIFKNKIIGNPYTLLLTGVTKKCHNSRTKI